MDAQWEEIDFDLGTIYATFGLRILQIAMTHNAEKIENRWKIATYCHTFEFVAKTPQELMTDLDHANYIRYCSLIIIVDRAELTDRTEVKSLLKKIKENRYLRYTPILLIFEYGIDTDTLVSYFNKMEKEYLIIMDNVILMQIFNLCECYEYRILMSAVYTQQDRTILEVISNFKTDFEYRVVFSCDDQLYFFNMNPTLAIIINNYHFTSPMSLRRGSEKDVAHLIREFKLDKIPYILVEDSGRDELMAVLKFMQTTNFSMLKRLMVFDMINLIHHFIMYFPTIRGAYIMPGGLFNIVTSLNESKFQKTSIARLYISPELDKESSADGNDDDVCLKLTELQQE